ncbi:hypothetical protein [Pseudonocardia acaciae]|uniref:hypothetical protein n=1 Tax=Pseudonocardia acaciae TaxID=551276 RepID=UPI000B31CE99|nr:hypothetical protein [Pseudonocardia acaciae]
MSSSTTARRLVLAVDALLLLAPPVHWIVSGAGAFWYFVIANLLVTLSLFVLWALRDRDGGEEQA